MAQVLQAPCGIEAVVMEGVGVGAVGDDGYLVGHRDDGETPASAT
ncbi:hypothetical protein [Streptomyces mirabilis]|nr:hypothetical protein [Streptomyces mirabilis]MCX4431298.1 hypothetical protein [Streptomyces mirabilis]